MPEIKETYNRINPHLFSIKEKIIEIKPGKNLFKVSYDNGPLIFIHTNTYIDAPFGITTSKEYETDIIRFKPDKYHGQMFNDVADGIKYCLFNDLGYNEGSFEIVTKLSLINLKVKKDKSSFFDKNHELVSDISILKNKAIKLYASISVPTILVDNSDCFAKVYIQFVLDQAEVEIIPHTKTKMFTLTRRY